MRPHKDAPPRLELVAHLREQIARNPEAYANDAKLRAIAERVAEDLREERTAGS